jgi:hypothetical protein
MAGKGIQHLIVNSPYWRDAKSQEFEQRYMTELFANVDKTVTVMDKLNELMTKVRNDCE